MAHKVMIAAPAAEPGRYVVGLTGGIGSGKTTVANLFAEHGAALIDTDEIARALTSPGGAAIPQIVAGFGEHFVMPDGSMNRAAIRTQVFADPAMKARLESILHPLIRSACELALRQFNAPYALLVVPLLVETGHYLPWCKRVLVVDCEEETQVKRVMQRSHLTREQVHAIMASQATRKARLALADDVIDNDAAPDSLAAQVSLLHERYIDAARSL